jgi:hypothetical protein
MMTNTNDNDRGLEAPTINRFAVVLKPTEVFFEWARRSPDSDLAMTLEHLQQDLPVYLIPDTDDVSDCEKYLQSNYLRIFRNELWSWCTDESFWPENPTYEDFMRWFEVRVHSVVMDLGISKIEKETSSE